MKLRRILTPFSVERELRILQWNCNGIRPKASRLREYMEQERVDVALIQETHLNPHHGFTMGPDFQVFRKDRISHKGRQFHIHRRGFIDCYSVLLIQFFSYFPNSHSTFPFLLKII